MGKRHLGNWVLVGDFSTDVMLAPPSGPTRYRGSSLTGRRGAEMVLGTHDMG